MVIAMLALLWCSNCLVLRIGPLYKNAFRLAVYSLINVFTTIVLWILGARFRSLGPSPFILPFPVAIFLIALHGISAILCFWVRRSERQDRAWLAALIPAPAIYFYLVIARGFGEHASVVWLVCALWIASMAKALSQTKRIEKYAEDFDFDVVLTGCSNCLAGFILISAPQILEVVAP